MGMRSERARLAAKWLDDIQGWIEPPGCETDHVESPADPRHMCCTIGIVHEHRFAFFYWALFAHERSSRQHLKANDPPILVTVDYHNDTGADSDVIPEDLASLDLGDRVRLGLFCWCRLCRLNDGQITPALFLNLFSDVYVLLKQDRESRRMYSEQACRTLSDRDGQRHTIRYFDRMADLLRALNADSRQVYLDVDLDYFTRDDDEHGRKLGAERLVSRRSIREFFSFDGRFVPTIFHRLVGFTIALEPKHCGGMAQSLKVFDILNKELFDRTLCTDECRWKEYRVVR